MLYTHIDGFSQQNWEIWLMVITLTITTLPVLQMGKMKSQLYDDGEIPAPKRVIDFIVALGQTTVNAGELRIYAKNNPAFEA